MHSQEISPQNRRSSSSRQAALPVQFLHLHHVRDEIKIRGVLGTDIKVSVEKENETAGKTNKGHGLWVVPEPRTTSSLILTLSQVTAGNRLKHRK